MVVCCLWLVASSTLGPSGSPSAGLCKALVLCVCLLWVCFVLVSGAAWGWGGPGFAGMEVGCSPCVRLCWFFWPGHRAAAAVQPAGTYGAGRCGCTSVACGSRAVCMFACLVLLACIACMLRSWWLECSRVAAGSGCWSWARRASLMGSFMAGGVLRRYCGTPGSYQPPPCNQIIITLCWWEGCL